MHMRGLYAKHSSQAVKVYIFLINFECTVILLTHPDDVDESYF
jgi:hypothetical protein